MNTIEGLTIRWQPWTVPAVLSHLLQSSIVGLAILVLMFAARRASARTRWTMAWIGLIKFVLPLIWFNPTVSRLKPLSFERLSILPTAFSGSSGGILSAGSTPALGAARAAVS